MRRERAQQSVQRQIDALERAHRPGRRPASGSTAGSSSASATSTVDKALATGDVEIADPAVPPPSAARRARCATPRSPACWGCCISIGIAIALRAVQRRVGEKDVGGDLRRADPGPRADAATAAWREQLYLEAFQFLRANVAIGLEQRGDGGRRRGRLIAVTSPLPGQRQEHRGRRARRTRSRSTAARCSRSTATCASRRWGASSASRTRTPGLPRCCSATTTPRTSILATPVPSVSAAARRPGRAPTSPSPTRPRAGCPRCSTGFAPRGRRAGRHRAGGARGRDVDRDVGGRRRDHRRGRARPAQRRARGHARPARSAPARNVLGVVLNRTELAEDNSLKSAYGRPYRVPALPPGPPPTRPRVEPARARQPRRVSSGPLGMARPGAPRIAGGSSSSGACRTRTIRVTTTASPPRSARPATTSRRWRRRTCRRGRSTRCPWSTCRRAGAGWRG